MGLGYSSHVSVVFSVDVPPVGLQTILITVPNFTVRKSRIIYLRSLSFIFCLGQHLDVSHGHGTVADHHIFGLLSRAFRRLAVFASAEVASLDV